MFVVLILILLILLFCVYLYKNSTKIESFVCNIVYPSGQILSENLRTNSHKLYPIENINNTACDLTLTDGVYWGTASQLLIPTNITGIFNDVTTSAIQIADPQNPIVDLNSSESSFWIFFGITDKTTGTIPPIIILNMVGYTLNYGEQSFDDTTKQCKTISIEIIKSNMPFILEIVQYMNDNDFASLWNMGDIQSTSTFSITNIQMTIPTENPTSDTVAGIYNKNNSELNIYPNLNIYNGAHKFNGNGNRKHTGSLKCSNLEIGTVGTANPILTQSKSINFTTNNTENTNTQLKTNLSQLKQMIEQTVNIYNFVPSSNQITINNTRLNVENLAGKNASTVNNLNVKKGNITNTTVNNNTLNMSDTWKIKTNSYNNNIIFHKGYWNHFTFTPSTGKSLSITGDGITGITDDNLFKSTQFGLLDSAKRDIQFKNYPETKIT